ncbi:MAG: minor capsid protein [Bacillota bacterium]|nr:minor capsid protein [Bacillota bacterium]
MNSEKQIENSFFENTKRHILEDETKISEYQKELLSHYEKAVIETEDRIRAIYSRFADEHHISLKEAKALISDTEQRVFDKTLSEYMSAISEEGASSLTKIELDKLSASARLSREEKLLADIYMELGKMAELSNNEMENVLKETLKTSFVRSSFDVQNSLGVYYRINMLSDPAIEKIVKHPWATKKYSQSLWGHVDNLNANIKQILADGFIQGKSIDKIVRSLHEKTGVCREAVERLVQNQVKYFANLGELEGYKANGIEKFVYMGSNELGFACNCASLNGVIINVNDAVPLQNFPPLHPHCQCSVRAYFEKGIFENKNVVHFDKRKSLDEWKHDFIIKNEEDLVKGLQEELKCDIIKAGKVEIVSKALANKASYRIGKRGGIDLNLYDDKGRIYKTYSNNDHGNPKRHSLGKFGEHVHDWIPDKKGIPIRQKQREVTEEEKSIMGRIL